MSIWMEMECLDPRVYLIANSRTIERWFSMSRTLRSSLNDSYRFHLTIDSYHVAAIIALNDRCLLFAVYLLHEEQTAPNNSAYGMLG